MLMHGAKRSQTERLNIAMKKNYDVAMLEAAIRVFARDVNVDIEKEKYLLPVVRKAFYDLPTGWEFGIGKGDNNTVFSYFFDPETEENSREHPKIAACFEKLDQARRAKREEQGYVQVLSAPSNECLSFSPLMCTLHDLGTGNSKYSKLSS
jgi:hypothetical protein